MAKRGTIRQAADASGLDQATIRRALEAAGVEGLSVQEAVQVARENADPDRIIGHAANGRGEGGGNRMTPLTIAKARRAELENQRLEIELAKAAGELIDRASVTRVGVHLITTARTALLSLGHRLAPKVAGKADIGELSRLIEAEVRDVLGALSDEKKFLTSLDDDALT